MRSSSLPIVPVFESVAVSDLLAVLDDDAVTELVADTDEVAAS